MTRLLQGDVFQGPDALDARRMLLEGNAEDEDAVSVVVRVNAEYPPGAPTPQCRRASC